MSQDGYQVINDIILMQIYFLLLSQIILQFRQQSYESNNTDTYAMAGTKCIFIPHSVL
jgi:hypothetical protein